MEDGLAKYLKREGFVEDIKLQLEKDIEGAEEYLNGQKLDSFETIYILLLPLVEQSINDSVRWMRIINRVDLNERQLKSIGTLEGTYTEKMTKAMLIRVFQKVALRWSNR